MVIAHKGRDISGENNKRKSTFLFYLARGLGREDRLLGGREGTYLRPTLVFIHLVGAGYDHSEMESEWA